MTLEEKNNIKTRAKAFEDYAKNSLPLTSYNRSPSSFGRIAELISTELQQKGQHIFPKDYTKQDVRKFLQSPTSYRMQLRDISNHLYVTSTHYKRLMYYFSNMLTYDYIIKIKATPSQNNNANQENQLNTYKKSYIKVAEMLGIIDFQHEFNKIMKIVFREDVFFGYVMSNKNSFYIKKLNSDACRISSVEDGCLCFEFDLLSLESNYLNDNSLDSYPEEIQKKYKKFKAQKKYDEESRWVELDSKNSICIRAHEDLPSNCIVPPFIGVVETILDLEDYKLFAKAKEFVNNYKLLVLKIPLRKDSDINDDFTINFDQAMKFYNLISSQLPDEIGVGLSPLEIDQVNFQDSAARSDVDNISRSIKTFWNTAGVNENLFGGEKASSVGLSKSIIVDEGIIFSVLNQVQRWVNRLLKLNGEGKFEVEFLNSTFFNREELFKTYLSGAQVGMPVKSYLCASVGLTPVDVINMNWLESDVLGLSDWEPLKSSHTSGSNDGKDGGRPEIDDDDLTDEGVVSKDGEKNLDE